MNLNMIQANRQPAIKVKTIRMMLTSWKRLIQRSENYNNFSPCWPRRILRSLHKLVNKFPQATGAAESSNL